MKYLLDTNICVFVIRRKLPVVLDRFQQFQPDELVISTVTLAELRYGADKSSNSTKNHLALDGFLAAFPIIPMTSLQSQAATRPGTSPKEKFSEFPKNFSPRDLTCPPGGDSYRWRGKTAF